MDNTTAAPAPSSVLFARGVIARLAVWEDLRVAVQENWGGPKAGEKRTWLAGVIVDAFEQEADTPDDQYIEEMMLQIMEDEFDTVIEDGSGEEVAKDIVRMWEETRLGEERSVTRFEELAEKKKGKPLQVQVQPGAADEEGEWEDDEDDEEETDEAPQLMQQRSSQPKPAPEVDDEGFTTVAKGKGRSH
ncbi:Pre-rRNA-processing protein TSR2-domain-containing protein [Schizophyllum amplum]|uniref:Pre-rRNA-processing protein TSR2-domain-containing protein n=1 Tax=Schizophyllum amplum TaxID=97359 RepID=A0A550CIU8_9AGAR|nr:Pre-rRNA-processing protein TSR2-domain-containing protein [Auriculariopsis ampla]